MPLCPQPPPTGPPPHHETRSDGPMDHHANTAERLLDRDGLLTHADAVATGQRELLRTFYRTGALERVAAGVYAAPRGKEPATPQDHAERYRRRVAAAARRMPQRVFTSYSAAALLQLPIVAPWPEDIYILSGGRTGSRRPGVREIANRSAAPVGVVAGIRVTAPEHTLLQLARHASLPAALVATDAALLCRPWKEGEEPTLTVDQLQSEHARLLPYHGSRRAAAVLARATSSADGPLETLSRFVIDELGFAAPELQTRFWLPGLHRYVWVDFYWPELNVAAEADGHGKTSMGVNAAPPHSGSSRRSSARMSCGRRWRSCGDGIGATCGRCGHWSASWRSSASRGCGPRGASSSD